MKPGTIQLGNASLHISYPQIVPGNLRGFSREITEFYVPEEFRGKGEGTELLKEVCEQADSEKIQLLLIADTEKLANYYERFGFVAIQKAPILMVRSPKNELISIH
jgi:GNAT superfamily N-acetyltransferase